MTRSQAARRLGVSLSTVRRMEGAELVPVQIDGKHLFRRTDIDLFVRADEGQLAAEAFAAFESGKSAVEVVIELRLPPEKVEALQAAWVRLSSRVVVPMPTPGARRHLVEMFRVPEPTGPALICAVELVCGSEELRKQWVERIARRYPSKSA